MRFIFIYIYVHTYYDLWLYIKKKLFGLGMFKLKTPSFEALDHGQNALVQTGTALPSTKKGESLDWEHK